ALGMSRIYLYMHIVGAIYVWLFGFIVVKSGLDASMIVLVRTMFYVFCTIYAMIYLYQKKKINLLPKKIIKQMSIVLLHSSICAYLIYIYSNNPILSDLTPLITFVVTISLYYVLIVVTGYLIKINYLESALRLLKTIKK